MICHQTHPDTLKTPNCDTADGAHGAESGPGTESAAAHVNVAADYADYMIGVVATIVECILSGMSNVYFEKVVSICALLCASLHLHSFSAHSSLHRVFTPHSIIKHYIQLWALLPCLHAICKVPCELSCSTVTIRQQCNTKQNPIKGYSHCLTIQVLKTTSLSVWERNVQLAG